MHVTKTKLHGIGKRNIPIQQIKQSPNGATIVGMNTDDFVVETPKKSDIDQFFIILSHKYKNND